MYSDMYCDILIILFCVFFIFCKLNYNIVFGETNVDLGITIATIKIHYYYYLRVSKTSGKLYLFS